VIKIYRSIKKQKIEPSFVLSVSIEGLRKGKKLIEKIISMRIIWCKKLKERFRKANKNYSSRRIDQPLIALEGISDDLLQKINTILITINEQGIEQKTLCEEQLYPKKNIRTVMSFNDPNYLLYSFLTSFWDLYNILIKNLDNPIFVFILLRIFVETAYGKIIYFINLSSDEKRRVTSEYLICRLAPPYIIREKEKITSDNICKIYQDGVYQNFVKQLGGEQLFNTLVHETDPLEYANKHLRQHVFPPPTFKTIENNLLTIFKSNDIDKIRTQYKYLSIWLHDPLFVTNATLEDKEYLFLAIPIILATSLCVLQFIDNKILKKDYNQILVNLEKNVNNILEELNIKEKEWDKIFQMTYISKDLFNKKKI